jgi:hypothetical protein
VYRTAGAATAIALLLWTAVTATADPPAPQADTACPADAAGAMTWPADATTPLLCVGAPGGERWQAVTTPQPPSDRWLSVGPEITLHGEGRRNPSVRSGSWTATPRSAETRCRAEQSAVVAPGVVGAPATAEAAAGQELEFDVGPRTFDLRLSGNCLWTRV